MTQHRSASGNNQARALARGLGWFSIALGAIELAAPGTIRRNLGLPGNSKLVQAYGLREIASGVAILAAPNPNQMVWSRVAGDMLDIATLLPALNRSNPHRQAALEAFAFVAMATAADLYCAMQDGRKPPRQLTRSYADRSGFPQGLPPRSQAMLGTVEGAGQDDSADFDDEIEEAPPRQPAYPSTH